MAIALVPVGGGGTDFAPCIRWLDERGSWAKSSVGLILCSRARCRGCALFLGEPREYGTCQRIRACSARRASTCRETRVDPQPLAVVTNGKRMIQASSFPASNPAFNLRRNASRINTGANRNRCPPKSNSEGSKRVPGRLPASLKMRSSCWPRPSTRTGRRTFAYSSTVYMPPVPHGNTHPSMAPNLVRHP
jgi:hypothetical protein